MRNGQILCNSIKHKILMQNGCAMVMFVPPVTEMLKSLGKYPAEDSECYAQIQKLCSLLISHS